MLLNATKDSFTNPTQLPKHVRLVVGTQRQSFNSLFYDLYFKMASGRGCLPLELRADKDIDIRTTVSAITPTHLSCTATLFSVYCYVCVD